ncbi:MAG: amidohydrolase family protein [Geodermatophilaceae bacterium]
MVTEASSRVLYAAAGVFDGRTEGLRSGTGVLVADGIVVAVGASAELAEDAPVRDFGDAVIVPGFVDAHTHVTIRPGEGDQHGQLENRVAWQTIRGVANLAQMLRSGVTTAKIMSEMYEIDYEFRDAVARGEVAGPRLLVAGPGLSPPGGHGAGGAGVAGVDDLRAAVRERVEHGADHIKIFTTGGVSSVGPSMSESNYSAEEIAAIVQEAASAGLKVSAHALGGPGVDLAVENGVHTIEHGTLLDAGNIERMVEAGTWLVLTTSILFHPAGIERGDAKVPHIMKKVTDARAYMEGNLDAIREAGIPFAMGTDSMHGLFGEELRWLVAHGWSSQDALVAATRKGGELIGDPAAGVLEPGSRADFVVLGGDPFANIDAVLDVNAVYRAGHGVVEGGQVRALPGKQG